MNNLNPEEWFPVVDKDGNTISRALRSTCHDGKSMLLHPVVHLHLFNEKGELFLQKRAMTKDLLPGFWDTSVGGHIHYGESVESALKREACEELGLAAFESVFLRKYIWESNREKELVYSYRGTSGNFPVIDRNEIEEGRFWSFREIHENTGKNIFTPNFKYEFVEIIAKESLNFGINKSTKLLMDRTVKILVLNNEIEAALIDGLLNEKNIPHLIRSYHDSAMDGLWQMQSGWGHLAAPEEFREEILKIYREMSETD